MQGATASAVLRAWIKVGALGVRPAKTFVISRGARQQWLVCPPTLSLQLSRFGLPLSNPTNITTIQPLGRLHTCVAENVGGGSARRSASELAWTFAFAGAAGTLLYHVHQRRAKEALALALSEQKSGHSLDHFSYPLLPPPDFRHPFEDLSVGWRGFYIVSRVIKLFCVFVPFVAASSLYTIFSGNADFRTWYLALMVRTLEDAGPAFQKLGQWLSMRPDLFDQNVIGALSSLRDDGPRHPFAHTRRLLEEAFGLPLEAVFEHIEHEPVASGSVAQVHRGFLRESFVQDCIANRLLDHDMKFREVAVKVLHPGVVETAWIDGDLIFATMGVLAMATGMSFVMPFDKEGFCRAMARQLDLKWEAYNLKQFQRNFSSDMAIQFPHVVAAQDSVLIESWFGGKSIATLFCDDAIPSSSAHSSKAPAPAYTPPAFTLKPSLGNLGEVSEKKRKMLASHVFDMTIKMYLRDNYIHGDLHGGNLLYSTDEEDERVYVLDAGLTTALERDWASPFGYMLHALTLGDADRVGEKLLIFNINKIPVDRHAFNADIKNVMGQYMKDAEEVRASGPVNMGAMMGHILSVLQLHRVSLRGDVAMTIVTMSIAEGLIRQLDPHFDIMTKAIPYFVRFRSWGTTSLRGKEWEKEVEGTNGGLPVTGNRGVSVTST